jgi:hypothetical protein
VKPLSQASYRGGKFNASTWAMQVVISGRPRRSEPSLRLSILCAMSLPRAVEEKERAMRGRDRQLAGSGLVNTIMEGNMGVS